MGLLETRVEVERLVGPKNTDINQTQQKVAMVGVDLKSPMQPVWAVVAEINTCATVSSVMSQLFHVTTMTIVCNTRFWTSAFLLWLWIAKTLPTQQTRQRKQSVAGVLLKEPLIIHPVRAEDGSCGKDEATRLNSNRYPTPTAVKRFAYHNGIRHWTAQHLLPCYYYGRSPMGERVPAQKLERTPPRSHSNIKMP